MERGMILAWHFLPSDRRLRYGPRTRIRTGHVARFKGWPILCYQGLHASRKAIDALHYAPGPIICRVELTGKIVEGEDTLVATERRVIAMADATNTLHEFACWCASRALKAANVTDDRAWTASDASRAAARDAARAAAWYASRAAARTAERAAAWATAWAAERDAQNRKLAGMFFKLLEINSRTR